MRPLFRQSQDKGCEGGDTDIHSRERDLYILEDNVLLFTEAAFMPIIPMLLDFRDCIMELPQEVLANLNLIGAYRHSCFDIFSDLVHGHPVVEFVTEQFSDTVAEILERALKDEVANQVHECLRRLTLFELDELLLKVREGNDELVLRLGLI